MDCKPYSVPQAVCKPFISGFIAQRLKICDYGIVNFISGNFGPDFLLSKSPCLFYGIVHPDEFSVRLAPDKCP